MKEYKAKTQATDIYQLFTITDKDIEKFQEIYFDDFGERISKDEAEEMFHRVFFLFTQLYKDTDFSQGVDLVSQQG